MKILKWFVFSTVIFFGTLHAGEWDLEYWQSINARNWESGSCRLYTIAEVRIRKDVSKFYFYRIAENFAYRALPWLDLEMHYSFIYHKSHGATRFANTSRLELELNPFMEFDNGVTITWRNRLELLKRQRIKQIAYIFRDRLTVEIPISNCGYLTAFTFFDEVFYDFEHHKFSQNRFVPIQLTLALGPKIDLDAFFMIRDLYSFSLIKWYRSFVIGSVLNF